MLQLHFYSLAFAQVPSPVWVKQVAPRWKHQGRHLPHCILVPSSSSWMRVFLQALLLQCRTHLFLVWSWSIRPANQEDKQSEKGPYFVRLKQQPKELDRELTSPQLLFHSFAISCIRKSSNFTPYSGRVALENKKSLRRTN